MQIYSSSRGELTLASTTACLLICVLKGKVLIYSGFYLSLEFYFHLALGTSSVEVKHYEEANSAADNQSDHEGDGDATLAIIFNAHQHKVHVVNIVGV